MSCVERINSNLEDERTEKNSSATTVIKNGLGVLDFGPTIDYTGYVLSKQPVKAICQVQRGPNRGRNFEIGRFHS